MPDLKRIKALFDASQELPNEQQAEYLTQSGCNQEEREQVLRLLGHASNEESNLVAQQAINTKIQEISAQIHQGQMLGPYRIVEEIGRGGMGVVFLAERADGQYQQQVAIKLAPSFSSIDEQKRFSIERQLLAELQHPNIAMLLDGGITEDQRPYLVMEYIKGVNLNEYCRQQKLSIDQKIDLFIKVCDAIAYAHNRLIIHRDIKPENVLVTEEGIVKLLDFGTSKLLQQSTDANATQAFAMTLSCASPEQISGKATTAVTDVYGLGALLYQLLTNTSPYTIDKENMATTFENILSQTPVKPSKHQREIAKDLDNICLKALEKDPEQRYDSVAAFKQDIKHFLQGNAVSATKSSLRYHFSKLCKRHPLPVILSASLLISLVSGLVISLNLTHRLAQEVVTSNQVIDMLTHTFEEASPEKAKGKPVDIQEFVTSMVKQTRNSLNNQPEVKARLLATLVDVTKSVGQLEQAAELQETVIELNEKFDLNRDDAFDQAKLGNLYLSTEQTALGRPLLLLAHEKLSKQKPVNIKHLARTKAFLSTDFINQGKLDQALTMANQAVALYEKLPEKVDIELIALKLKVASAYYQKEQFPKAIELANAIVKDAVNRLGADHPSLIKAYAELGLFAFHSKDNELSLSAARKGYELAISLLEPNNNDRIHAVTRYADVLKKNGDVINAISTLENELQFELNENFEALLLRQRAPSYMLLGYYHKAIEDLQQILAINTKLYPPESARVFPTIGMLGISKARLGELDSGQELIEKAIKYNIVSYGDNTPGVATSQMYLADIAVMKKDYSQAKRLLSHAETVFATVVQPDNAIFGDTSSIYVSMYMLQQDWQLAKEHAEKSIAIYNKRYPVGSPTTAKVISQLGEILWHLGDKQQARELITNSFETVKTLGGQSTIYQELKQRLTLLE